jgi:hypothetical protein
MILAPELGSEKLLSLKIPMTCVLYVLPSYRTSLPLAFPPIQHHVLRWHVSWLCLSYCGFLLGAYLVDSNFAFWWSWSLTNCSKPSHRQLKINNLFPDTARSVVGVLWTTSTQPIRFKRRGSSDEMLQRNFWEESKQIRFQSCNTEGKNRWEVGHFHFHSSDKREMICRKVSTKGEVKWCVLSITRCQHHRWQTKRNSPYNQSVPWRGKLQFSNPCFGDKNTYVRSLGRVIWNLSGTGFVAGRQTG